MMHAVKGGWWGGRENQRSGGIGRSGDGVLVLLAVIVVVFGKHDLPEFSLVPKKFVGWPKTGRKQTKKKRAAPIAHGIAM